jgi:hypothetical protein
VRLATVRRGAGTHAVRVDGEDAVDLGVSDVGALLARPDWRDYAAGHDGQRFASDFGGGRLCEPPRLSVSRGDGFSLVMAGCSSV